MYLCSKRKKNNGGLYAAGQVRRKIDAYARYLRIRNHETSAFEIGSIFLETCTAKEYLYKCSINAIKKIGNGCKKKYKTQICINYIFYIEINGSQHCVFDVSRDKVSSISIPIHFHSRSPPNDRVKRRRKKFKRGRSLELISTVKCRLIDRSDSRTVNLMHAHRPWYRCCPVGSMSLMSGRHTDAYKRAWGNGMHGGVYDIKATWERCSEMEQNLEMLPTLTRIYTDFLSLA